MVTAAKYLRPEAKGATAGGPGITQSILDPPGTQRGAGHNAIPPRRQGPQPTMAVQIGFPRWDAIRRMYGRGGVSGIGCGRPVTQRCARPGPGRQRDYEMQQDSAGLDGT